MSGPPTKVVYILGSGHSGSTLLSLILASHEAIEGPGELKTLIEAWRNGHFCACGRLVRDCVLWTAVMREFQQRSAIGSVEAYEALRVRAESPQSLSMLLVRGGRPSPMFQRYLEATTILVETIASVSGRKVVVDASKNGTRACTLSLAPRLDVRLVHLVRDPRGVCFSLTKPRREDLAVGVQRTKAPQRVRRTAVQWILRNAIATWLRWHHGPARSVLIRYEDLVSDLPGTLGRVAAAIDVDLSGVIRRAGQGETIRSGHVATGNRLRMANETRIRFDDEWTRSMLVRDRRVAEVLTAPWRRAYGYE